MKITARLQHDASVSATLTDEHTASSYGQPVLVIDGRAYGPGDAYDGVEVLYLADYTSARAADIYGGDIFPPMDEPRAGLYHAEIERIGAAVKAWHLAVHREAVRRFGAHRAGVKPLA